MAGKLTTHVLDTAHGCPASEMYLELWLIDQRSDTKTLLKTTKTNQDGRTDEPLLKNEEIEVGIYEIIFDVGEYFGQKNKDLPNPPFLTLVPIRFSMADVSAHYHVPLLTSPWAYSTYRGS
ncbi:MAG: hydroxyisourate hydrolase [Microcystaceae cyanobacterium]